jgi:hypothetical protein
MSWKLSRCALAALLCGAARTTYAQQGATGRLEGSIIDSVHDALLTGMKVSARRMDNVDTVTRTTVSDARGHYQFDLPPGRYSVSFASALLDSLEYGVPPVVATVPLGTIPARVDLATPSGTTLRAAACPGTGLARWTGALLGVVSDAETRRPLDSAEVFVAWTEQAIDSSSRDIVNKRRVEHVATNVSGQYRICGLPTDERLNVQIGYRGAVGPVAVVMISDEIGVRVRNVAVRSQVGSAEDLARVRQIVVEPPKPGRSAVAGKITRPDGQPVVGAQLRLLDGAVTARSDERGEYSLSGLPDGAHELEVRHLGYGLVRRPIVLRDGEVIRENIALERVVSLDSVRVVAHRMSYPEFEKNRARYYRGTFMDADEIAKRGFRTLPLLVQSTHGFRTLLQSRGRVGLQSLYLHRCNYASSGVERLDPLNLVIDNMEHMDFADVEFPIVEAVEIYPEGENAPFKYQRACSVIVVWTKRSAKRPKNEEFQQLKQKIKEQDKREKRAKEEEQRRLEEALRQQAPQAP